MQYFFVIFELLEAVPVLVIIKMKPSIVRDDSELPPCTCHSLVIGGKSTHLDWNVNVFLFFLIIFTVRSAVVV